jgi:ADP-heptose:LPS heptosyltransferase
MAARLRAQNFTRIYDLDSGALGRELFHLLFGRNRDRAGIPWNGDIPGTALSGATIPSKALHVRDRLSAQLKAAGITEVLPPDLTWVARRVTGFHLPVRMTDPFVLLAVDPAMSGDTWPAARFAALAETVVAQGLVPVLVGLRLAPDVAAAVAEHCPTAVNLTGRGEINDLVFLAWAARGAVGCDNGLMHVFALAGCRAVVLHDASSDPALTGQRGHDVIILRRPRLDEIPAGEVVAALKQKRYVEQGRFT